MSYILVEYRCSCGDVFESLESRSSVPNSIVHPRATCGGIGERVLSAVSIGRKYGEVTRGRNEPPPQHALDTRPMAEGMSMHEWRKQSRAKRREVIRRYG